MARTKHKKTTHTSLQPELQPESSHKRQASNDTPASDLEKGPLVIRIAKRTKVDPALNGEAEPAPSETKKRQTRNKGAAPTRQLPERASRRQPVAASQSNKRRTKAQMEAAKHLQETKAKELEDHAARVVDQLEQTISEQDLAADTHTVESVFDVELSDLSDSDVTSEGTNKENDEDMVVDEAPRDEEEASVDGDEEDHVKSDAEVDIFGESDNEGSDQESGTASDAEERAEETTILPPSEQRAQRKEALRSAIDRLRVQKPGQNSLEKQSTQPKPASSSSKIPNTKTKHPSGLVENHHNKLLVKQRPGQGNVESAPGKRESKAKMKGKKKEVVSLSNQKASHAQPTVFSQGKRSVVDAVKQSIKKRQKLGNVATTNSNDIIELSDSEEQLTPGPSSVVGRKVVAKSIARTKQEPSVISIKSEPSIISIKSEPSVISINSSPPPPSTFIRRPAAASKKRAAPASPISLSDSSSAGPALKHKYTVADIPQFLIADWQSKLVPTLNDVFFCADHPYKSFCQSNEFKDVVAQVLNFVIPGHTYEVHPREPVYCVALDRIQEKRSDIGGHVAAVIEEFFKGVEYGGQPDAIVAYAKWARKKHGPAFYRIPTPVSKIHLRSTEKGYQAPVGIFESDFVVEPMNAFLNSTSITKSKAVDVGYPKSLLALVCAALEFHFDNWSSGGKRSSSRFCRERVEPTVDRYMKIINKLSNERWEHLLELYGMPKRDAMGADRAEGSDEEDMHIG